MTFTQLYNFDRKKIHYFWKTKCYDSSCNHLFMKKQNSNREINVSKFRDDYYFGYKKLKTRIIN